MRLCNLFASKRGTDPLSAPKISGHLLIAFVLKGENMPRVLIKCPNTGKDVPTNSSMRAETFHRTQITHNSFKCPACGEIHTWATKDAFLEDERPTSSRDKNDPPAL
jgi:hypothetical protein